MSITLIKYSLLSYSKLFSPPKLLKLSKFMRGLDKGDFLFSKKVTGGLFDYFSIVLN